MERLKNHLKRDIIYLISMLAVLIVGCGGGSSGSNAPASSSSKAITTYSIPNATVVISEAVKTITVTVPYATDVTALIATFTATGSGVKVGSTVQTSAVTVNNFTTPVTYALTAVDGSVATYIVTIIKAPASAKNIAISSFIGVLNSVGVVNEVAKTIAVTVPYGTDVTALVATFVTTGSSVEVGATVQTSTVTPNNFTTPVSYVVSAADTSTATYVVTVTVAPNSAKAITTFSFVGYTGANGTINEVAKTIAVTVPYGTDVTALVATFATTGSSVKVASIIQTSATTTNNFSSPVSYVAMAADGSTAAYTVAVIIAPNSAKAITSFSFAGYTGANGVINEPAKTIALTVPYGTNVTALVATFATTGSSVKVGGVIQASAATTNNFTTALSYVVRATDASTATYAVTVTVAPNSAKAITSFSFAGYTGANGVINETAKTIAVTVPYGTNVAALIATFATTGNSVKVGVAEQTSTATTNNFTTPVSYTVRAADTSVATYAVTVVIAPNSAKTITSFSFAGYTGANGVINESAKTIAVTVPYGTDVTALVATFATTGSSINVGSTVQTSTATTNNFTTSVAYAVKAADNSTATYVVTVAVAPNSAKAITAFSFAAYTGASGVINEVAKTIAVTVPYGTDVTTLIATFTTTGNSVKVGAVVQTSAATTNNFTTVVLYAVKAADTSMVTYAVTVTVAPNSAKAITAFSFTGYTGANGVINESAKTIAVTVPYATDVTTLVATFTTTGNSVKVGTTEQTSTATTNNFNAPVLYTVRAADNSTATYVVTVTVAPSAAKAITSFSFAGYTGANGVINEVAKTMAVTVPYATDVTALVATFATTGSSVNVGTVVQTSTATTNNFATPVSYIVKAANTSVATYVVTVTVAPNSAKAITAFSFTGYTGANGVINESAKTIAVTVPYGTDVTALVATFATTGNSVKVGTVVQTSTATVNNFTSTVSYVASAADASTATYVVTVIVAPSAAKAITAFSFATLPDSIGVINEGAKTIQVSVLPGADVTALIATFTTTGNSVKVGTVVQTSTATTNNFTSSVLYKVTAADTSTAVYTVTVVAGAGPVPINLGTAANFAVLTKTGISSTGATAITGDIGISPNAATSIAGFALIMDSSNTFSRSTLVSTKVYAANYSIPTPSYLSTAISDMESAYTDGAGRTAGVVDLKGGTLNNDNLSPATYEWGTVLNIPTNITLTGGANDVWIFKVSGALNLAANKSIILVGGAQAKNIFWQVSGAVTLEADSSFSGNILTATNISLSAGATVDGRLLAQTAATLVSNRVVKP